MADAVLTQRLLVGVAPLALGFLLALVIVVCFLLAAKAVDRLRAADAKAAQILAETVAQPADTPAAPDNEPGINLADHDECNRILNATNQQTAALDAGCDRLWAAIRDAQQKGEQA